MYCMWISRPGTVFHKISMILLFVAYSIIATSQPVRPGSLVIVGGGLEQDNREVYRQFLEFAGGPDKAVISVIPAASGVPVKSFASFRNNLMRYGVKPENIHLIEIALVDDDSTDDADESAWKDNGRSEKMAALVRSSTGVWFTGGDQSRTTKALLEPDGSRTPVLEAVWSVYLNGGVLGGTSAGAAIMSEAMIAGGSSIAALTKGVVANFNGEDLPETEGLMLSRGLGFFPSGVVDQHFNQRSRIGRLIMALFATSPGYTRGFGVDENTALIYSGAENLIKVAGASGVTIVDIRGASLEYVQGLPDVRNVSVSYLENGDSFDPATGNVIPDSIKTATEGNESYDISRPGQAGILSGNQTGFRDLLTAYLIDNKGTDTISNISFFDQESGYKVILRKTRDSRGYYSVRSYDIEKYTVTGVMMDLIPVSISVIPFKEKE